MDGAPAALDAAQPIGAQLTDDGRGREAAASGCSMLCPQGREGEADAGAQFS